ncbi:MAG: ECF transporter S component [Clostridia bacterium]|nr:ECF transporter S component [Clostridia bacterium]
MSNKILKMVQMALLCALIIVLQQIVIPLPGGLTLSLVLIPIVVGAVLLGPSAGAALGAVFGAVVTFLVITGRAGELSTMMWIANPVMTVIVCMLKGTAAGLVSGLIAKALTQKKYLGIVLAAAAAPIVNTGIFLLGMFTAFRGVMQEFADKIGMGGTTMIYFAVIVLVGVNFLVEFAANLICSPAIVRVVDAVKKSK